MGEAFKGKKAEVLPTDDTWFSCLQRVCSIDDVTSCFTARKIGRSCPKFRRMSEEICQKCNKKETTKFHQQGQELDAVMDCCSLAAIRGLPDPALQPKMLAS